MKAMSGKFVLLAFVLAAANAWSQGDQSAKPATKAPEQAKYYRLDFVVKETENGKQVTTRNYSLIASTANFGNNCSVRAGDKIPTFSGKEQFTYIDVGVNLDCRELKEVDEKLALRIQADISGAAGQVAPEGQLLGQGDGDDGPDQAEHQP